MPLTPLAYVCVVSGFNLPEFEACLARKPSDVLLVVSDNQSFAMSAQRLKQRLEHHLPEIQVHILHNTTTGASLSGDDLIEGQMWAAQILVNRLQRFADQGKAAILNFTGGTKALSFALLHSYPWQAVDYRPQGRASLQVARLNAHPTSALVFTELPALKAPELSPLEVASLHDEHVSLGQTNPLITQNPSQTATLAKDIWYALNDQDPALETLFLGFEKVWQPQSPHQSRAQVRLSWTEFLQHAPTAQQLHWLTRIAQIAPHALTWDQQGISLPSFNSKKHHKALREWISGTWLEQLAYQWLLQAGVPEQALACNVKSGTQDKTNHTEREADLLIHYRSRTHLIEAKADLLVHDKVSEMVRQVQSISDRFGRTNKLLLLGPQLTRKLAPRWDDFYERCKASQITPCCDAKDLYAAVGIPDPNNLPRQQPHASDA